MEWSFSSSAVTSNFTPNSFSSAFVRPGLSHTSSTLCGATYSLMVALTTSARIRADGVGDIGGLHELLPLPVDDLALVVRHVVVLEQLLADVEVVGFDLALCALDLPRQQRALDDLAGLHARARQHPLDALRVAEDAHQVVFERQIEPARARVALAARSAAQLVVDAPRLVAFRADDVQPAHLEHFRVALAPVLLERGQVGLGRRLELARARRRSCRRA